MINRLYNSTRKFGQLLSGAFGNNALATINDVNDIVDQINAQNTSERYTIAVSHPLGLTPTVSKELDCTCESGNGNCPSCCVKPCGYRCKGTTSIVETSPGTYEFTFNPGVSSVPGSAYVDSYMKISNLSTVGYNVTVEQTAPFVFTVKTYDVVTGIVTSNIFKNTVVEVIFIQTNPNICVAP